MEGQVRGKRRVCESGEAGVGGRMQKLVEHGVLDAQISVTIALQLQTEVVGTVWESSCCFSIIFDVGKVA